MYHVDSKSDVPTPRTMRVTFRGYGLSGATAHIQDGDGNVLASVYRPSKKSAMEKAAMFAATAELLAACKELAAGCESVSEEMRGSKVFPNARDFLAELAAKARAAIAKSEGGTS